MGAPSRIRFSAGFLLVLMVFTVLPRTWFHHCDEGHAICAATSGPMVQVDRHCPICEAPAPLMEGVAPVVLNFSMACLGEQPATRLPWYAPLDPRTVDLRGPPATA